MQTIIMSVVSIIVLLIITRILGYRQISQLSLYDYIIGITIGSICAELSITDFNSFYEPLISLIVYGIVTLFISKITQKSNKIRYLLEGKPVVLFFNNEFYYDNFQTTKIDMSEFLMNCRNLGYFDLSQIYMAILETNGKLSILPTTSSRPVNVKEMQVNVKQEPYVFHIIIDGKINENNLKMIHKDHKWLKSQLANCNLTLDQTFLATFDSVHQFRGYKK